MTQKYFISPMVEEKMIVSGRLLKAQVSTENYIRIRRMTNGTGMSATRSLTA